MKSFGKVFHFVEFKEVKEVIASLEEFLLEVIASLEVKEVIALRARSYSRMIIGGMSSVIVVWAFYSNGFNFYNFSNFYNFFRTLL